MEVRGKEVKVKDLQPVKKAKKGLLSAIFSRTFVLIAMLLVQLIVFGVALTYMQEYVGYIYIGFLMLGIISVIYIVNSPSNSGFKMSWIMLIIATPIFGTAFYLFVKAQPGTKKLGKRLMYLSQQTRNYTEQDGEVLENLKASKPANANLVSYLSYRMSFPVWGNTEVTYFPSGEDKFEALKEELRKAEDFIFMEYFIVEKGVMWNEILDILKQKVWEGVEVRFMYDGMNSISHLPINYDRELRRAGIKCKQFSPVRPFLTSVQNNRDHRKICVIDGKTAFTGGINLADEYINARVRFGYWKDTAIMMKGDAVQSFTMMFLEMWNLTERRQEDYGRYVSPESTGFKRELGYVLPYGDSPYDKENIGEQVYVHILNHAKKYVHIMTPYLILDEVLLETLQYVAKCGIEVVIIMPHIPDKWYAFWVAKTFYKQLMEAGVQIYEFTPGFVHAKVFVSDNDTATVGSVNLDYRSLYHHFECGAFIYNNPVVWDIEKDFQETLAQCQRVTKKDLVKQSIFSKLIGQILRIVAPLM